jgi:hypothetical protein
MAILICDVLLRHDAAAAVKESSSLSDLNLAIASHSLFVLIDQGYFLNGWPIAEYINSRARARERERERKILLSDRQGCPVLNIEIGSGRCTAASCGISVNGFVNVARRRRTVFIEIILRWCRHKKRFNSCRNGRYNNTAAAAAATLHGITAPFKPGKKGSIRSYRFAPDPPPTRTEKNGALSALISFLPNSYVTEISNSLIMQEPLNTRTVVKRDFF